MKKVIEKIKIYLIAFLLGLTISCAQSTDDLLDGTWTIDTISYKEKDIFEEQVFTNMMSFNIDNTLSLPKIGDFLKHKRDHKGKWFYNSETDQITFESKHQYIKGVFNICFKKDWNKGYIKIVLQSNDVYIEAGKALSPLLETTILPITCKPEQ